jgi:hypothetical protein
MGEKKANIENLVVVKKRPAPQMRVWTDGTTVKEYAFYSLIRNQTVTVAPRVSLILLVGRCGRPAFVLSTMADAEREAPLDVGFALAFRFITQAP